MRRHHRAQLLESFCLDTLSPSPFPVHLHLAISKRQAKQGLQDTPQDRHGAFGVGVLGIEGDREVQRLNPPQILLNQAAQRRARIRAVENHCVGVPVKPPTERIEEIAKDRMEFSDMAATQRVALLRPIGRVRLRGGHPSNPPRLHPRWQAPLRPQCDIRRRDMRTA
ncbi:hypothetical protein [Fodinicurvata halophila]|uniref:hypothetical protein n=1 Tax=Fodinicurvata halophila TaxID=1419723 RepID=UPI0036459969